MSTETRILKRGVGSPDPPRFNVRDLQLHAVEILEQAKIKASEIISEAETEAEAIFQRAAEQGQRHGHAQGLQDARDEVERRIAEQAATQTQSHVASILPVLEKTTATIESLREEWRLAWEREAVMLAIAIAEKIIDRDLRADPSHALKMIDDALELACGRAELRVHVHPQVVSLIEGNAQQYLATVARCADLVLVPDESVAVGGCVIESANGSIDARLETQLQRIAEELSPGLSAGE